MIEHALRVKQLMHSLQMVRFISIQPLLAMKRMIAPKIEEEFILTIELLNAARIHGFPPLIEGSSVLGRGVGWLKENLQRNAEAFGLLAPSLILKNYRNFLSCWDNEVTALKYFSRISSISRIPLLDFYGGNSFRAPSILKPFYKEGASNILAALRNGGLLAGEDFRAVAEKLRFFMEWSFKPFRKLFSPTEAYNFIWRETGRLQFYEAYAREMIYYSSAPIKSIFSEELERKPFSGIHWSKKGFPQHEWSLLFQPAMEVLSRTGKADLRPILPFQEHFFGGEAAMGLREKLHEILSLKELIYRLNLTISPLSGMPSLSEFNIQTFIREFACFSFPARSAYLNLVVEPFIEKLELPLSAVSNMMVETFTGKEYWGSMNSAVKEYAEVREMVLNILKLSEASSYGVIQGFSIPQLKIEPLVFQLTKYLCLMEKSTVFHSSFSGIKSIISNILSSSLYEGWVKTLSGGLATQAYSTSIKAPFEGFYREGILSPQSLKLHEIASVFQTLSAPRLSASETIRVQHPINVTVRVESLSNEGDLKELERKIIKILREEARRYGLNI